MSHTNSVYFPIPQLKDLICILMLFALALFLSLSIAHSIRFVFDVCEIRIYSKVYLYLSDTFCCAQLEGNRIESIPIQENHHRKCCVLLHICIKQMRCVLYVDHGENVYNLSDELAPRYYQKLYIDRYRCVCLLVVDHWWSYILEGLCMFVGRLISRHDLGHWG